MLNLKTLAAGTALAIASVGLFAQTATPRADTRQAAQERRIDAGVKSGELNATEAKRMENQQAVVNKVESNAKADGTVTKGERAKIHHTQKKTDERIRRQKHDAQTAN